MRVLIAILFLISLPVQAQDEDVPADTLPPSTGNVIIEDSNDDLISEFRINGALYMIRITPKKGVPYYLVDSDGDGQLETRWDDLASELLIPAWVLIRW
jgi:hypothetical protein